MSKVYTVKGKQIEYQEILSRTFYSENDLERTILTHLNTILTDFYVILFKASIRDSINDRNKEADLAIIKKDYSEWYIVEVELTGHSFSHVKGQIESFYNGEYSDYHAEYIEKKMSGGFDLSKLKKMISTYPPKLLVIVDQAKEDWTKKLEEYNCKVSEFQIYLDIDGSPAYRLRGFYPTTYTDYCFVKVQKGVMAAVELLGQRGKDFCSTVDIEDDDILNIEFGGYKAKWKRNDDGGKIYLDCEEGFFPLDPSTDRYMMTFNNSNKELRFKKT